MPPKTRKNDVGPSSATKTRAKKKKTKEKKKASVLGGELSEEEVRGIFDLLDTSQSGRIRAEDLSRASIKVGISIDVDLAECMLEYAREQSMTESEQEITLEQFKAFIRMFQ